MNIITTLFTADQIKTVDYGIKEFILLQGLIYDPSPLVWNTWLADEGDLKSTLCSVRDAMLATERFLGKQKYVGVPFNPVDSVSKDILLYLTADEHKYKTATLRKRNLPMFILVIEPVLSLFSTLTHRQMIDNASAIIADVCDMVDACMEYGSYTAAQQAQSRVYKLISQREEERKKAIRPHHTKKQRAMAALLLALGSADPSDLEDMIV